MQYVEENGLLFEVIGDKIKSLTSRFEYRIELDKNSILADGIDFLTATVKKYDYLNKLQNVNEKLVIEIDGTELEIDVISGIGRFEVSSNSVGEKNIITKGVGLKNGSTTFKAN